MHLHFYLRLKPEAQKRHRTYGRIQVDPSKEYKNFLKLQLLEKYHGTPLKGALVVNVTFRMPIPSSTSKKRKEAMRAGEIPHVKRPDLDNLVKALLDALNKTIIEDDSQIFSLYMKKTNSDNPGITLSISAPPLGEYMPKHKPKMIKKKQHGIKLNPLPHPEQKLPKGGSKKTSKKRK